MRALATDSQRGLSSAEASRRLAAEGPNELPAARRRGTLRLGRELLGEPMFLLLIGAGTLYLVLGDAGEAAMLFVSVLLVAAITIYQQRKTERAIEALRGLSSPRALVVRDGEPVRLPARELVRGDLVLLEEGDRVPADAAVLEAAGLLVDESLLTGESIAVSKRASAGARAPAHPGGDEQPYVYSSTLVVRGRGRARVDATGPGTFVGRLGRSLESVTSEPTRLHRETARLVRVFALVGLALCAAAVPLYGLLRRDWTGGVLAGLTLAIAMVPEEFPVVLTIFLALGAWRMSGRRVLARRSQAIEALGSATVLCADKTGTLTLNRMAVAATAGGKRGEILDAAALASRPDAVDPIDRALVEAAGKPAHDLTLAREYPLSSWSRAVAYVWSERGTMRAALKGAPETVARLCRLGQRETQGVLREAEGLAAQGLRVLGVARARPPSAPPASLEDVPWRFVGLVALADPVRPAAPEAVAQCRAAGIRVLMITGDHPRTAAAIARQLGLPRPDDVATGDELSALDEAALRWRVRGCDVFARVLPEQKLRLVEALKADGQIVAMTGDGVNDSPALKAAHIGVAMGGRGSDVAREAAALVLLDDDFASLVAAIRMGRRIFDNIRRAMSYLLAVHVPLATVALVPVALGMPLVLLPVHVVFLELIIDPACSIVFEADPEEADIMSRPPRPPGEPLFARRVWLLGALQGFSVAAIVLGVHALAGQTGWAAGKARAASFTCLVLANLALILTNLSSRRGLWETLRTPNRPLWWTLAAAVGFLALVLEFAPLRRLFLFDPLGLDGALLCLLVAALTISWLEATKLTVSFASRRQK